jgi:hypothetical protein
MQTFTGALVAEETDILVVEAKEPTLQQDLLVQLILVVVDLVEEALLVLVDFVLVKAVDLAVTQKP